MSSTQLELGSNQFNIPQNWVWFKSKNASRYTNSNLYPNGPYCTRKFGTEKPFLISTPNNFLKIVLKMATKNKYDILVNHNKYKIFGCLFNIFTVLWKGKNNSRMARNCVNVQTSTKKRFLKECFLKTVLRLYSYLRTSRVVSHFLRV